MNPIAPHNHDTYAMYDLVASAFAARIESGFASEDTLRQLWIDKFKSDTFFDRTQRWDQILKSVLEEEWFQHGPVTRAASTPFDRDCILDRLVKYLDFNLFTQVMLNVQVMQLVAYRVADAEADRKAIEARYPDTDKSPMAKKAKMYKTPANEGEEAYNRDLSALKAIKIISEFTPTTSFRVTPKGSTPALVDSANISALGVGGDRYLQLPEGYGVYFIALENLKSSLIEVGEDGKSFRHPDVDYPFTSSSGGDILAKALLAREVAYKIYPLLQGPRVVIPRLTSVMIICHHQTNEDALTKFEGPLTVGVR